MTQTRSKHFYQRHNKDKLWSNQFVFNWKWCTHHLKQIKCLWPNTEIMQYRYSVLIITRQNDNDRFFTRKKHHTGRDKQAFRCIYHLKSSGRIVFVPNFVETLAMVTVVLFLLSVDKSSTLFVLWSTSKLSNYSYLSS